MAEADQRAAAALAQRGPARPAAPTDDVERVLCRPRSPRERLAVELWERIVGGEYAAGSHLPGVKALAVERGLSPSTVKRALDLLREWGLIFGVEGERPAFGRQYHSRAVTGR
ncbi:GntR family transcriptional regulator [Pseudonocardia adelaidensis]|uniref:GntR family transcriptional regulator n=1 Tax=Pseudonocardia adelaidensis TaxID=648754 RepID=UPI0031EDABAC